MWRYEFVVCINGDQTTIERFVDALPPLPPFRPQPTKMNASITQAIEFNAFTISFSEFEKLLHLRLHAFIHLDQWRPRAFEAFAGEFFRRINAQFAADGDFAGGVVEHIRRAFGEDAVAL